MLTNKNIFSRFISSSLANTRTWRTDRQTDIDSLLFYFSSLTFPVYNKGLFASLRYIKILPRLMQWIVQMQCKEIFPDDYSICRSKIIRSQIHTETWGRGMICQRISWGRPNAFKAWWSWMLAKLLFLHFGF